MQSPFSNSVQEEKGDRSKAEMSYVFLSLCFISSSLRFLRWREQISWWRNICNNMTSYIMPISSLKHRFENLIYLLLPQEDNIRFYHAYLQVL